MAHSLGGTTPGIVGGMYASGVRGLPGGASFTLTGIFIDRITPRLMAVSGAARMAARGMNAMSPELNQIQMNINQLTRQLGQQEAMLAKYEQQLVKLKATEVASFNRSNAS